VRPLGELRAVVGRPFSVTCPASGYPLEKITWTKGIFLKKGFIYKVHTIHLFLLSDIFFFWFPFIKTKMEDDVDQCFMVGDLHSKFSWTSDNGDNYSSLKAA